MRAVIAGPWINLYFRYDPVMVQRVRGIADREYMDSPSKHWRVPATSWHARRLVEEFGTLMTDEVRELAKAERIAKKVRAAGHDGRLRTYQKRAVDFAQLAGGRALIGDDCGLGKTPESLIYAKENPDIRRVLIVAPASVVYKWKREVTTWMGAEAQVLDKVKTVLDAAYDVQIVSYEIARERVEELAARGYDLLIVDECHYIKSYKAQRTRAVKQIAVQIPYVLALSGTPFLSRPIEMFTTLHLLKPEAFPNWFKFGQRYGGGEYVHFAGATNIEELRTRLEDIMIRRLKSDVKDELPKLTRSKMPVVLSNKQQYRDIKAAVPSAIKAMRKGRPTESKDYFENALEKLTLLREVVGLGKVDAAIEWATNFLEQTDPNRKLVIYAHHDSVVQALKVGLQGYTVGCIIGGTSKKDRDTVAGNFQAGLDPRVLIISSAGGVGIDLFGLYDNQCSDMLVVEREWTSAEEEQAESRLHRQGQHNAVNVWILVARGTIDEDIDELIDKKRELMGDVLRVNVFETVTAEVLKRMEEDSGKI